MKEVNAVKLRQSVSKVARTFDVGLIVSIEEYSEHFERERDRAQQREELVNAILADRAHSDETIEEADRTSQLGKMVAEAEVTIKGGRHNRERRRYFELHSRSKGRSAEGT